MNLPSSTSTTPLSSISWTGGFASPGLPWVCPFGVSVKFIQFWLYSKKIHFQSCETARKWTNRTSGIFSLETRQLHTVSHASRLNTFSINELSIKIFYYKNLLLMIFPFELGKSIVSILTAITRSKLFWPT